MNLRLVALVIPVAIASSAATTTGIMLYQAGRLMDRLGDSLDMRDAGNALLDGQVITKEEHKRIMDELKDEIHGRAI